jgi:hypothetical protein
MAPIGAACAGAAASAIMMAIAMIEIRFTARSFDAPLVIGGRAKAACVEGARRADLREFWARIRRQDWRFAKPDWRFAK